jgi:hypothetical protein
MTTVARYLRGEVSMDLDDIEAFAAALGLTTVDLIARSYDGAPPASRAPVPTQGNGAAGRRWAPRDSNPQPTDYKVRTRLFPVLRRAA